MLSYLVVSPGMKSLNVQRLMVIRGWNGFVDEMATIPSQDHLRDHQVQITPEGR
jgi:hypothetical protein